MRELFAANAPCIRPSSIPILTDRCFERLDVAEPARSRFRRARFGRKPGLLANLNDDFGLDRRFSAERGNTHRRAGMLAPLAP